MKNLSKGINHQIADEKSLLGGLGQGFDNTKKLVAAAVHKMDGMLTRASGSIFTYIVIFTIMIVALVYKLRWNEKRIIIFRFKRDSEQVRYTNKFLLLFFHLCLAVGYPCQKPYRSAGPQSGSSVSLSLPVRPFRTGAILFNCCSFFFETNKPWSRTRSMATFLRIESFIRGLVNLEVTTLAFGTIFAMAAYWICFKIFAALFALTISIRCACLGFTQSNFFPSCKFGIGTFCLFIYS